MHTTTRSGVARGAAIQCSKLRPRYCDSLILRRRPAAWRELRRDNLPGHDMHRVKPVGGALGKVGHVLRAPSRPTTHARHSEEPSGNLSNKSYLCFMGAPFRQPVYLPTC